MCARRVLCTPASSFMCLVAVRWRASPLVAAVTSRLSIVGVTACRCAIACASRRPSRAAQGRQRPARPCRGGGVRLIGAGDAAQGPDRLGRGSRLGGGAGGGGGAYSAQSRGEAAGAGAGAGPGRGGARRRRQLPGEAGRQSPAANRLRAVPRRDRERRRMRAREAAMRARHVRRQAWGTCSANHRDVRGRATRDMGTWHAGTLGQTLEGAA